MKALCTAGKCGGPTPAQDCLKEGQGPSAPFKARRLRILFLGLIKHIIPSLESTISRAQTSQNGCSWEKGRGVVSAVPSQHCPHAQNERRQSLPVFRADAICDAHRLTALSAAVGSELIQTAGGTETGASTRARAQRQPHKWVGVEAGRGYTHSEGWSLEP